jgi:hypothetical protein
MNRNRLAIAVAEAERFLSRVKDLPDPRPYQCLGRTFMDDNSPRESGAIRRASMDLTRALADLRKPG